MQVFGLPGHVIRSGREASRLLGAQTPDVEAAGRRDAVRRWRAAMDGGLTGEAAAKAVAVPRATLYRWERQPKRRSSRPHRVRSKNWPSALVRAVERLRQDYPMWGRAKLGPMARREGFSVSDATVGRIVQSLVARGVVRGINRDYLSGLYAMALRPHLTFWLNVRPETAFAREFKKAQAISYWEAGRDMSLSHDLYWSFIRYQTMIKREFEAQAKKHNFIELDGEANVPTVNKLLRQRIADHLGIRGTKYNPSSALAHLWR